MNPRKKTDMLAIMDHVFKILIIVVICLLAALGIIFIISRLIHW